LGHTPAACAVDLCRDAAVRRLALTHHDLLRNDDHVDGLCEDARTSLCRVGEPMEVLAAAEGMVVDLKASLDTKAEVDAESISAVAPIEPAL